MKSHLLLVFALVFCRFHVTAQGAGPVQWEAFYYSPGIDYQAMEIKACPEGGYIMVGSVTDTVYQQRDMLVLRVDVQGEVLWEKTYGAGSDDQAISVIVLEEGDFMVCGTTGSWGEGQGDMILLRLDTEGELIWQETYGTIREEGASRICEVSGGYIASGFTDLGYGLALLSVKFDYLGEVIWVHTFENLWEMGMQTGTSVAPLDISGAVVSGMVETEDYGLQAQIIGVNNESGNW